METKTVITEKKHDSSESIKIPVKLIVSVIAIIAVVILAFFLLNSNILRTTGNVTELGQDEIEGNLLNFFATQVPESNVTIISTSKQGSLYQILLNVDGQEVPIFVTSDGKYLVVDPIPLE